MSGKAVVLVGFEDACLVVGLSTEIRHVVARKQPQGAYAVFLGSQSACQPVAASGEVLDGLEEFKVGRHGLVPEPARVGAVHVGPRAVDALRVSGELLVGLPSVWHASHRAAPRVHHTLGGQLKVGIDDVLVGEAVPIGLVDGHLLQSQSGVHEVDAQLHLACFGRCVGDALARCPSPQHVLLPVAGVGISGNAEHLRCGILSEQLCGIAQRASGMHGEGGQQAQGDDILASLHGQHVFGIGCIGSSGVCLHVHGPYGDGLVLHAQSLQLAQRAAGCHIGAGGNGGPAVGRRHALHGADGGLGGHRGHLECWLAAWRCAHDAVPFAVGNVLVVDGRQPLYLVVGLLGLVGILQCQCCVAQACLAHALHGPQVLHVHQVGSLHGIFNELEIGIAKLWADARLHGFDLLGDGAVGREPGFHLLVAVVDEHHVLRLAARRQSVVFLLHFGQGIGHLFAKGLGCPVAVPLVSVLGVPGIDVPRQVHAELQLCLGRLDVAHVDDPQPLNALLVASGELVADLRGAYAGEPQIVLGRAVVGQMVVDAMTARPLLLGIGGHLADESMIVVDPCEGDVVGHVHARVVGIEHLFVGDEGLRHLRHVFVDDVVDEAALEGDDLL